MSATYCLAAAEESFGSINKQVSLKFREKKKQSNKFLLKHLVIKTTDIKCDLSRKNGPYGIRSNG